MAYIDSWGFPGENSVANCIVRLLELLYLDTLSQRKLRDYSLSINRYKLSRLCSDLAVRSHKTWRK